MSERDIVERLRAISSALSASGFAGCDARAEALCHEAASEIARLREERKPVGWCVQAAAGSMVHAGTHSPILSTVLIRCVDEAYARSLATVYGHRVFAIVEADAKEGHNVPLQK